MATSSLLPPLNSQVEIVDQEGKPTPYFTRLLQQLSVGTGLDGSSGTIGFAAIAAKTILANKTAGSAVPTACTISDILDFVTSTRGSVLYRGNTGWAALAPGTAGQVLQTNGAGADPSWGTAGSSAPWYWSPPTAASFTLSNASASNMILTDNTDVGLIIDPGATWAAGALSHAFALRTLASASAAWTMTARFEGSCNGEFEYNGFGLCLYESSTNKFIEFDYQRTYSQSPSIAVDYWNSGTSFSSDQRILHSTKHPWLRVVHDGTNYKFQLSSCGKSWFQILSVTNTAWLAGKADKVGFTMGCARNTDIYWQYTCQNFSIV